MNCSGCLKPLVKQLGFTHRPACYTCARCIRLILPEAAELDSVVLT